MLNMDLHLKWLPNVFELWKLVHRKAPEVHFFLTPGVGRLSVQLRQHNKLLCLILEAGKKCCSGSLVWVNLNNSNESDLHSQWGTWFCMLEMRSSQRLMLIGMMFDGHDGWWAQWPIAQWLISSMSNSYDSDRLKAEWLPDGQLTFATKKIPPNDNFCLHTKSKKSR